MNIIERPGASRFLWGFAVLFIGLGLGYGTLTPIFENSDETLHYPYAKHLADGQGLPLATPGQLWNQEGTQHPLYYAIVAASTFWIDTDNLPELLQRNPHWLFTEVRAVINDNQNLVLHGPMDAFPYRRAALAIQIGRAWSLVFGLATVIAAFLLARHLFPRDLPLTLTATALTAFNPQFIRVSTTVSNDSLSAALTTIAVLAALKFTEPAYLYRSKEYRASPRLPRSPAPLLLGLLCGLALLTKLSSVTTLIIVALILFGRLLFLSELHQSPWRMFAGWLGMMILVTGLLTGWWFWRNYTLYGEWLATETHLNLAGRDHLSPAEVWRLRAEIERAYWATFGWGQIRPPEWVYQGLFWLVRIGLVGVLAGLAGRVGQWPRPRPLPLRLDQIELEKILLLAGWAGLNVALYLRWVMAVGSVSHSRLMFPAIAAISLLLAVGWHALLPRRWAGGFSAGLIILLLALNVYSLGWLIYPAFRPEGRVEETVERLAGGPLNLTFLNSLQLRTGQVYPQAAGPGTPKPARQVQTGEVALIEAEWKVMATPAENYSVSAVLLGPDGRVLARRETYPGLGLRPTRYLSPGQVFGDTYPLRLAQPITEPLVAHATLSLFEVESATRAGFPALNEQGQAVTPVVGQIKVVPAVWPVYQPEQTAQVNFGDVIRLTGYDLADLSPEISSTGQEEQVPAQLTLYWESLAPVEPDYNVFLHLLDGNGQIVAQADAPPTNQAYPTSWWAPGEIVADRRLLPVSAGVTTIRLGLYDLGSGQRIPVVESSLPEQDSGVEISLP